MEIEITDTIRNVDERAWNALVGTKYIERTHAWYRTVEDSGMRRMYYILLKENSTLTAAACCFPYKEKRYIEVPFLEVRSPLVASSAFFFRTPEQAGMLLKGLEDVRRKEKVGGISILELKRREFISLKNHLKRFTPFPIQGNTFIDLQFTDFEDYLSSLDAESRRSIRKTLNRAEKRWNISVLFTNEFSRWKKVANRLQGYTCQQHNDYRTHLTEAFYDAVEKHLRENAELILFLKDDIPIVSGLSLYTSDVSLHKAAGIDPQYREYQAYFLLYYEGIKRAIERNQKRIYFGPSTYEFKEKIGCSQEELFGLVKMRNPLMNMALKSYVIGSQVLGRKF
ncbi:MAG: GNAT family N-acetyltransferase [Theionarchaea archaeon]|nr:GNAT family N-acetyltransferase [Theionarchaea archaeon]